MAKTVAEIQEEIAAANRRRIRLEQSYTTGVARLSKTYANDQAELQKLLADFKTRTDEGLTENDAALTRLNAELAAAQAAEPAATAETPPAPSQPPQSAAQTVAEDAPNGPTKSSQQEVDTTTGRVVVKPETTAPSNADAVATTDNGGGDQNTNPPTTTTEQSQAPTTTSGPVPAKEGTADADPATAGKPVLGAGVGAKSDDAGVPNKTTTQAAVNTAAQAKIIPQPNVLDKFGSYTYNASVYLLTPAQYKKLLVSKKKQINGYQLLFQSGGAPNNIGGKLGSSEVTGADRGRNPAFDLDFYIDSITVDNALPGKMSGAAHMVTDLKFTVVEPNGISLLDRLYEAVQDHVPKNGTGAINYTSVTYLMVIRFYGYDENGKLIGGSTTAPLGADSSTIIEKYIPFIINGVDWTVSNKLVSYDFKCSPTGQGIGGTTRRGTIPYNVELSDSTVAGLLGGNAKYNAETAPSATPGASTTASATPDQSDAETRRLAATAAPKAPQNANAAPNAKKAITQGLMGAMNDFQKSLVQEGIYQFADEYYIEFADQSIADATIVLPGKQKNKAASPQGKPATQDAQTLLQEKVSANLDVRNFAITAGQQILQAIELTIRNSSYISNQALTVVDEETGVSTPNPNSRNQPFKWFQISMQAEPKEKEYDSLRNDYAYKITFVVSSYAVPNFVSSYFPASKFPGVHKSYNYWFTGLNTAVLDYQANFNNLYTITVTGTDPKNSAAAAIKRAFSSSMRDVPKYNYAPNSTESSSGAKNTGNEISANAAEYLYDPSSLGEIKLKIIGDPAWIQQGSAFAGVNATEFNYSAFLPDGTINFDSQQVLFEIAWQRPEDYSLLTGLADPYSRTQKTTGDRQPIQSYVYQANRCVSEFKNGRFEQTLEGALYMFPNDKGTNTAPTAAAKGAAVAASDGSNDRAEAARLSNYLKPQAAVVSSANATNAGDAANPTNSTPAASETETRSNTSVQDQTSTVKGVIPAPATSLYDPFGGETSTSEAVPDNIRPAAPAAPVTTNGEAVETEVEFTAPPKIGQPNPEAIINNTNEISKDGDPG